ncbi:GNAT family N-acetyltransferase [Paraburkholderia fungorum]|uniref:GNAT family N-acetyltransferase n=1 Tax=Paraburkholderia fungorum TaxID=134537 RepID=UPI000A4A13F1|nr:GNAT family N-acetyltransferase [Paraburkholderia fungorum]
MVKLSSIFVAPKTFLRACMHIFKPAPQYRFDAENADGITILKAISVNTGAELGRMSYSTLKMTRTTYIWDIEVLPRWRRRGVGKALLLHAATVSPYPDFGLVTVVPESILFWRSAVLSRSLQKTMRVRMGLTFPELDHLARYQASFERPPYLGIPVMVEVDRDR